MKFVLFVIWALPGCRRLSWCRPWTVSEPRLRIALRKWNSRFAQRNWSSIRCYTCWLQETELVQAKDREVAQAQQEIQASRQRVSLVCVKLCMYFDWVILQEIELANDMEKKLAQAQQQLKEKVVQSEVCSPLWSKVVFNAGRTAEIQWGYSG